ncbi:MAG TPA: hypothetical protein VKZ18_15415 [Polyangia bacterium]|nr:hypothetical protein [Polyangia bacterium]
MIGQVVASLLALHVQGVGSCPSPAEVEARLAPLFPPGFASSSNDAAVLVEEGDGTLSVSLARPDGKAIARRRLPRAATCGEQSQTVAVALAVWEAQIHPEISLRLDRLAPAASPPVETDELAITRAAATGPSPPVEPGVGAAVMGAWQPGSLAPGGRLDGVLGRADARWRGRLSLAFLGTHTESLPPGEARWWRLYFALGADYVLPLDHRWALALGAAGVFGFATVEGAGFTTDRTARTADVGLESTLRVDLRLDAVRPWLGLVLVTWLRRQTLDVTGAGASVTLPVVEPMLALGVDFYGPP